MSKLLFIANSPSPNTTDLYRALNASNNLEICVVYTAGQNKKWATPIAIEGYDSIFLPTGKAWLKRVGTLIGLILSPDTRLVVVQGYVPLLHLLGILALTFSPQRPWLFWGERMRIWPDEGWARKLAKRLMIRLIRGANRVLAVGTAGVESYAKLGINRDSLSSVPYARDLSQFLEVPEKDPSLPLAIVCTARLVPSKGIDRLISAFVRLARSRPDVVLNLIGDGPERAVLEAAVPMVLRRRVIFHGYLDTEGQARVYAHSDVFALPSYHDGWGMVVLEAMAAGLPVVTTDAVVSGAELLEDGRTGRLVQPGDTEALTEALRRLVDDALLRKSQGDAARCVARRYDCQKTARRLGKILSCFVSENE